MTTQRADRDGKQLENKTKQEKRKKEKKRKRGGGGVQNTPANEEDPLSICSYGWIMLLFTTLRFLDNEAETTRRRTVESRRDDPSYTVIGHVEVLLRYLFKREIESVEGDNGRLVEIGLLLLFFFLFFLLFSSYIIKFKCSCTRFYAL